MLTTCPRSDVFFFLQASAQAMQRFTDDTSLQRLVCIMFRGVLGVPDGVRRVREVNGWSLVCATLRFHMEHVGVAADSCWTLAEMLKFGLASSIDLVAAKSLAEAARCAYPSNAAVHKRASDLAAQLLAAPSASVDSGVSPERAALARVAELHRRRDFASLVRDMDAFPECEELQQAGCEAIRSIMRDHGGSAKAAAAAGAVEYVVRALDLFQHSAETQRISLKALKQLMGSRLDAVVCTARDAGAVRLAVRALRSFPEDNRVIDSAFYVLGNLVTLQKFCEDSLSMNALELCVAALRRRANDGFVQGGACGCLAVLCGFDRAVASDALSMGAMELALAALRNHCSNKGACACASALLKVVCFDETHAVKAKQFGAPALLQAALKAHLSTAVVQRNAAAALAHIQRFVDAACARADAKMAELIEEAAKRSNGGAAPKKAGKGKGKGGEGAAAGWIPPAPPRRSVGADGEPALTKAQIKRRRAKAAAAARKAAAASVEEEEEEEEGSDVSSGDSEPPRSRPPIDFSKDAEFRRRLPPVTNSPLVISPELLAASDAILAAHAAMYAPSPSAQPGTEGATPQATSADAAGGASNALDEALPLVQPSAELDIAAAGPAASSSALPTAGGSAPTPWLPWCDADLAEENAALRAANAWLEAELAALRTRVAALEAELPQW